MDLANLAGVVVFTQARVAELNDYLSEVQRVMADLKAMRMDAAARASEALDGIRKGTLSEEVGAARYALALNDISNLDQMIATGKSAMTVAIDVTLKAEQAVESAQCKLTSERRC